MKLKLKYQLALYYAIIVAIVISGFLVYNLQQNRDFNVNHLRDQLSAINREIYEDYLNGIRFEDMKCPSNMRFTVLDTAFSAIYISDIGDSLLSKSNNIRDEIIEAAASGEGTALRLSGNSNKEYLYYAKRYPEFYLRTSMPFQYEKITVKHSNNFYQYAILILIIALLITLFFISRRLTKPLKAFNEFFTVMKSNKKDFSSISFPNNEYGDVGRKIVETYDQLEQVKKFKQQMTHNIAHELKTPLTGIRAYLETILDDDQMSVETMRKFTTNAYRQTLRLTSLVQDVSTLNKLEEESEYYQIEEVNISQCLDEIEQELEHKLKANNTVFKPRISSELVIRSNHDIIYSLFKNLVDNTIEHAGPNTTITVMAGIAQISGEPSYRINFTYKDNGKGIPEAALGRLFDRFYRIDEGRSRKSGGSGLGLSIVKSSVAFHNGTIIAENDPDGGLVFKFSLLSL